MEGLPLEVVPIDLKQLQGIAINYNLLSVFGTKNTLFEEILVRAYQIRLLELWEEGPSQPIVAAQ
jgi:hypothetical protein